MGGSVDSVTSHTTGSRGVVQGVEEQRVWGFRVRTTPLTDTTFKIMRYASSWVFKGEHTPQPGWLSQANLNRLISNLIRSNLSSERSSVYCFSTLLTRDFTPHMWLCGKFTTQPHVWHTSCKCVIRIFFFVLINIENRSVWEKKTRVLMKNVCCLSTQVLKIKYKNKCEDKI